MKRETSRTLAARVFAARPGLPARLFATLSFGLLAGALLWVLGSVASVARAGDRDGEVDPPGRVGRIVELHGNVSRYDQEEDRWSDAERNRPITTGDRLSTAGGANVELRVGSTVLRLGGGTELEVVRLDDERLVFELHGGSLALRVRTGEKAAEIEVTTREVRLLPLRAGHYRIDREGDTTWAGSWRGDLRVDDARRLTAGTGQRLELTRDERTNELRHVWRGLPSDEFAAWAQDEDRRDERRARSDHVSPEMTGAEDLDRWGSWDRHPEYGVIWYPYEVSAGWAPYRHGRWVWVRPWGWTWVDEARWGFAPFHYGRWVYWRGRWCWAPGGYVRRPVYAPALVAWVGGPGLSVSINIGGPAIGWVPLAPRERYIPHYHATPVYIDRVNTHPRFGPAPGHPRTVPTGPIAYTNQGVPGAVTVVPRDVLSRREPVARAVINVPEVQHAPVTSAPPAPVVTAPRAGPGARDSGSDDGRPGRRPPPARSAEPDGPAGVPQVRPVTPAPGMRVETPRRETPPVVGTPRQDGGGTREPRDGPNGRDGREPRSPREGRDPRDSRRGEDGGRAVSPAPPVRPVAPAQPAPGVQPVPSAPPAPRVQPAPPAVQAPPSVPRVQPAPSAPPAARPAPPRAEDDRKRAAPPGRQGERERDANR